MRLHLDSSSSTTPDIQPSSATGGSLSASARGDASGAKDSIAISTTSSALGQIASDRAAKLQQLSSAIALGTYQIPSAAISGAILAQAAR